MSDPIAAAHIAVRAPLGQLRADLIAANRLVSEAIETMQRRAVLRLSALPGGAGGALGVGAGVSAAGLGGALAAGFERAASAAAMLGAAVTTGVVASLTTAVHRAADFEQAIVDAAVGFDQLNRQGAGFAALEQAALEWGAKTSFSAQEAAQALAVFGQAGLTQQEGIAALGPTLASAAANTVKVADAADLAVIAMRTYNKSAADLQKINDTLTIINGETAASFSDLRHALTYAAPAAVSVGVSFEEVTALIGMLSNVGVRGEQAGTVLRGLFSDLVKPTREASGVLDKFKISVEGIDKPGRFVEVLKQLQAAAPSLEDMTRLVGIQQAAPVLKLLNSIDRDGTRGIEVMDKLVEKVNDVANVGATERRAAFKQDSFWGDWEKMLGALDTSLIRIGQPIAEALRPTMRQLTEYFDYVGQWATANADTLTQWSRQVIQVLQTVGAWFAKAGMWVTSLGQTTDAGKWTETLLKGFNDVLAVLDVMTADAAKAFQLVQTEIDIFVGKGIVAIEAFLHATGRKFMLWAGATALAMQQMMDPKAWLLGGNEAVEQAIAAMRDVTLSSLLDEERARLTLNDKLLQTLLAQRQALQDQIRAAYMLRSPPPTPAPVVARKFGADDLPERNVPLNEGLARGLGAAHIAGMVGNAGLAGMFGGKAGMDFLAAAGLLPGGAKGGGNQLDAPIGGAKGGGNGALAFGGGEARPWAANADMAAAWRGGLDFERAQAALAFGVGGGLGGAGVAMNPPGAIGPAGMALVGGGPAVEAMLQAVAAGAEEGVSKGQVMGLRDYQRAVQDALLDATKSEKSDWQKLLEYENKQVQEQEKIAKGIDALLKKKFSIFGGD